MKKLLLPLLFVPGLLAAATAPASTTPVVLDQVIAVINQDPVTSLELSERLEQVSKRLTRQKIPLPAANVLQSQLLDYMIMEKAQLQLAANLGISVDDLELSRIIDQITAERNVTLAQYQKTVTADGLTWPEARQQLRTEVILSRLKNQEVDDRIRVSNAALSDALQDIHANSTVELAQVMLRVPENASPQEITTIRQKADDILARARSGESFAGLAVTYSNTPEALSGGTLGKGAINSWPPLFANAVEKMKAGDISPVLRSPAGFHILKLVTREASAASEAVPQTQARQIVLRVKAGRNDQQTEALANSLSSRIQKGEDFATLARAYSDDPLGAEGGTMDWVAAGDLPPTLETALGKLKIGATSAPLPTAGAWTLLQVIARRTVPLDDARLRQRVLENIKAARSQEEYANWLRQLRNQTYVEIFLPNQ